MKPRTSIIPQEEQDYFPYLFTTRKGKITENYMGNIALDITKKTGIHFHWHNCRHTYAKNLLRNGADLETIRQMLGHDDLSSTQIYSVLDTEEAIARLAQLKVKFYREGMRFKSIAPYEWNYGPAGI